MSSSVVNFVSKQNHQEFLSNGTFDVPSGVTKVHLVGCGGGGGGVIISLTPTGAVTYGGFGAQLGHTTVSVTPGDSISVTIGAGGAGGPTNAGGGADGGNTTFGSLATFIGASGGFQDATGLGVITLNNAFDSTIVNVYQKSKGNLPWRRREGSPIEEVIPDSTSNFAAPIPSNSTDYADMRRGGTGGFGLGGAGSHSSSASSAAANSGGGGGSTFIGPAGNGGSGRLIVYW